MSRKLFALRFQFLSDMDALNASASALRDSVKEVLNNSALKYHISNIHTAIKDSLIENKITVAWTLVFLLVFYLVSGFFTVPAHLRHLPCVPIFPLLKSYLSGEVEDTRIKRLILPYANERGEGVVLVWALGRWMVHILDEKVCCGWRPRYLHR